MGSPVHTMRQTSATMKERPRVTSTCASSAPASRRRMRRSMAPPKTATASPPTIAAVQKSKPHRMRLTATYAPSMKKEPCVRFAIFMSPKISEKPAESRKRRPPSVMLLMASTSVRLMSDASRSRARRGCPVSALQRRVVTRVDRLRQEPLLVIGPELAHVRIGLDRRVDELVALALGAAYVEAADDVAEVIEMERPARRVGERYGAQRLDERILVVGLPARLFERGLGDHAVDVDTGGVDPRNVAVVAHHPVDEPLVARRIEVGRVAGARDHAERLVAEGLEQGVVTADAAAENGQLEALVPVLLHELERI